MSLLFPEEPLGGQTVTVYERERLGHREYRDTGRTEVWSGCLFRWISEAGEAVTDGRVRDQQRGRITAPPGSRAAGTAQCTVEPGPVDEHGAPARLSFDGAARAHWDLDGAEDHVTAVVTLSS